MRLYGYWRSSSTWRVRIGLHLKELSFETEPVNLLHGEHRAEAHLSRNAMGQVPALEVDYAGSRVVLTQSIPILEFIEEHFDGPALLPSCPVQRAQVRALAEIVNSGIQPLQNLAVLKAIEAQGGDRVAWSVRWIGSGLRAIETQAALTSGPFLVTNGPTLAEACLIPQLYNARRFGMTMADYPNLAACEDACMALAAFTDSHPDRQPDAVS